MIAYNTTHRSPQPKSLEANRFSVRLRPSCTGEWDASIILGGQCLQFRTRRTQADALLALESWCMEYMGCQAYFDATEAIYDKLREVRAAQFDTPTKGGTLR